MALNSQFDEMSNCFKIYLNFSGEVPDFKKFSKESKSSKERRKQKRGAEAKEAEEYAKELGLTDEQNSLTNAIMQRQVSQVKDLWKIWRLPRI